MKSMNNNNNNNSTNWLGFSLSPQHQMKIEAPNTANSNNNSNNNSNPHHQQTSFFHSPPQLSSIYFGGVENDQDGALLSSPLPVMPLKSDGSLCIMEALSRSHPAQECQGTTMVTGSTPKLEDFFGGATMGTHHHHQYETNDSSSREAMALSLDSMYNYQTHEPNNQNHQNQQIQFQHFPYYNSGFRSHEMLLSMEEPKPAGLQLPSMGEDEINGMKSWISRNFQMNNNGMVDNGSESGRGGSISAMSYGDLQSLSLSMSPGSQSSCVNGSHQQQISPAAVTDCGAAMEISKKRGPEKVEQKQIVHRKSIDTFGQRTSQYRGVTRHRWTGRYEAHLWDNSCKKEGQSRKGRQVYLGGYDMEEKAARSYDLAALKYWGPSTHINFPLENYQKEIEDMKNMTRQEYVAHLRRKSSGFSRGASMYRGVTRHHQHGRWQARIGRVAGNKDLYLGTFSTQEEAAEAYDIAAIKFRGVSAVTNFDITRYDVERIMASNTLLAGELARRNKGTASTGNEATIHNPSVHIGNVESIPSRKCNENEPDWKMALYQSSQQLDQKASNVTDNYKTQEFSLAPENFIRIDTLASIHQQEVEDSAKMGTTTTTTYMSNASSLVTSLGSSREGSPDHRANLPMLFTLPPSAASKLLTSSPSNVSSWFQSPQLKPNAVSLPHMPVFAAWTDA